MSDNILEIMKQRGGSANNGIKKLGSNTATKKVSEKSLEDESSKDTVKDMVSEMMQVSEKEKRRLSVSFDENTFNKLITLSGGKSVSRKVEELIKKAIEEVPINEDMVKRYNETMSNKGRKTSSKK